MANHDKDLNFEPLFVRNMIESFLRIGLLLMLLILSYDIIRPFTVPLLWGSIIAIAAFPLVKWLEPKLGGRRGLAATVVSLVFILALVIPAFTTTSAIVGGLQEFAGNLEDGNVEVPPPNPRVAEWPFVGERVYEAWSDANRDLGAFVTNHSQEIKELVGKLVGRVGSSLAGVAMFVLSIAIAGGFMTFAEPMGEAMNRLFIRIGGREHGSQWAAMCVATVRNVLQGVVGVAIIQATLVAIGLFWFEVPAAPLLSAIILVVAIAQLPPLLVLAPVIIWMFSNADTGTATMFMVYQLLAGASDNVLKPMLMGRGLDIPMPVILLGAIGGMIMSGIIGLFAGAVVLSIWYKLFQLWMAQNAASDEQATVAAPEE